VVLETLHTLSARVVVNRAAWHLRPDEIRRALVALMEAECAD